MSNVISKIVAFFTAVIIGITGFFGFYAKNKDKQPDVKPTTTTSSTTKKTTAKTTTKKTTAKTTTKKTTAKTTTKKTTAKTTTKKTTTKLTTTAKAAGMTNDAAFLKSAEAAINAVRKANGAADIKYDTNLTKAATTRAKEISKSFSHTRPNGKSCTTVFESLGLPKPASSAENIASASKFVDVNDIINLWKNSTEHKKNMCNTKYTKFGMAWYKLDSGKEFAVLILA